jgi:DNA repair protein RadD
MSITLRRDQIEDVDHVRDALRPTRRVLLCRPCGTGKTIIFCAITERVAAISGARTLILQHRDELIAQTAATLTAMAVDFGIIAAGYPSTPAPVQIASIASLGRRLDTYYQPGDFKLLFVDEAHHAAAPTWRRVIDHFTEAYAIGCTASPLRLDGKGLDHLFDELVVGRTVKDYVALEVLAPAVTFAPAQSPDLSGIRTRGGDYEQEALADRMADSAITGDAVEHYKRLSPQLPGLVYCCSIAHSQQVCAAFTAAGFAVRHVDGETPAAERERTIADLRAGKLDLVTNVGLFTEGLDVPCLGIVIVLRPTKSLALHLQMVGRALRTAPGKRRGLLLDHAGNSLKHGLYDFDHEWSLQGRPKKSAEPLVRQCPQCGALLPVRAETCPECGYRFVVQLQPPRLPNSIEGELERVTDDGVSDQQLRQMPYLKLLAWCRDDPLRLKRARAVRRKADGSRYAKGWEWHTAMAWRSAQRRMQGEG